jgi:hypothetical protein
MESNTSILTNPQISTSQLFNTFAYHYQLVIGISFSLSQSDPITRRLLYFLLKKQEFELLLKIEKIKKKSDIEKLQTKLLFSKNKKFGKK